MADRWLLRSLGALVVLTAASCLQVAFAPLGPSATLEPMQGPIAGFTATTQPPWPGRRDHDLAVSATERLELRPSHGGGPAIELNRTALAVRRRRELQVAALTAADPGLALHQRRLLPVANGEVALGTIGDQAALQGCRSWNGRSVVSSRAFLKVPRPPAPTTADKFRQLLGLSPNRTYTCELLTLTTAPGPGAEAQLKALWDRIELTALQKTAGL